MTQISAIYAKRSRSILNQFGQTNIQVHNQPHHPARENSNNNNFLSPNTNNTSNNNHGRGSVSNTGNMDSYNHHDNK